MGYHRAGFEVVGVDIKPQPHYPFKFYQTDIFTDCSPIFSCDIIHASPPCQRYTRTNAKYRENHPDQIDKTREILKKSGVPFVIENVPDARFLLENPIMLCGSMFGLPIHRHRFFEIQGVNFFELLPPCNIRGNPVYITGTPHKKPRKDPSADIRRKALGTPWMTIKGMDEAIPPAYTEWIGRQIIKQMKRMIRGL